MDAMEYAVILEAGARNYSAYVPDLPGCVATGTNEAETIANIRDAVRMHIQCLQEAGEPVPPPSCKALQIAL